MTRNIQDEYPLILSQPREADKDKKIRNENRIYLNNVTEWIRCSNPAFWNNQLNAETLLIFLTDGEPTVYLNDGEPESALLSGSRNTLQEEIMERALSSIALSTYQGYSSLPYPTAQEEIMKKNFEINI